ncbi:MAG: type II secretion system protein [Erysipelothrix sp.]
MKNKDAFTMVENVIALAILAIVLVSFFSLIVQNQEVIVASDRTMEASQLGKNELEAIIYFSNTHIADDLDKSTSPLSSYIKKDKSYIKSVDDFEIIVSFSEDHNPLSLKVSDRGKIVFETWEWLTYAQ